MENGIDSVVLTVTKNDANAMVVITNDDDQTGSPEEAVLGLVVGSNTLTVTVTAEDGSTTQTYTVTVERLAAPPPEVMVPGDWSLIPSDLDTGDQFRVLFLSSIKTDATSTGIEDYNTFIKNRVAAGHTDIQAYSAGFRAVGCTAAVDARDNTNTVGAGVPIYWLNGSKAADDNADFYDGDWDDEANDKNESGTDGPDTSQDSNLPFTGCEHNGTKAVGVGSRALGASEVRIGRPQLFRCKRRPPQQHQCQEQKRIAPDVRALAGLRGARHPHSCQQHASDSGYQFQLPLSSSELRNWRHHRWLHGLRG